MADPWAVVSQAPSKPSPYETNVAFRSRMDAAFGKGGWKPTSDYRDPTHNKAVGGVSRSMHMQGSPDAPGAHDIVVGGTDPATASKRLPGDLRGLPEGDHLHVSEADPWKVVAQAPSKPPAEAEPVPAKVGVGGGDIQRLYGRSPKQTAEFEARKPRSQGGAVEPGELEPARQYERQATLGATEALEAGEFAARSQAPRLAGRDPGFGPVEAYDAARQAQSVETRSRRGAGSTAAGVAGGVAGLGLGGVGGLKAAGTAEGLFPRLLPAAKAGAPIGAVAGAAGAEKAKDVPVSTALGATAGAVAGVTGEVLLSGAKIVGQVANTLSNSKFSSAVDSAAKAAATGALQGWCHGPATDEDHGRVAQERG